MKTFGLTYLTLTGAEVHCTGFKVFQRETVVSRILKTCLLTARWVKKRLVVSWISYHSNISPPLTSCAMFRLLSTIYTDHKAMLKQQLLFGIWISWEDAAETQVDTEAICPYNIRHSGILNSSLDTLGTGRPASCLFWLIHHFTYTIESPEPIQRETLFLLLFLCWL